MVNDDALETRCKLVEVQYLVPVRGTSSHSYVLNEKLCTEIIHQARRSMFVQVHVSLAVVSKRLNQCDCLEM